MALSQCGTVMQLTAGYACSPADGWCSATMWTLYLIGVFLSARLAL